MPELELVRYEVRDRVAEITMQREPVNAISMELTQAINAAYRRACDDDEVRAIILTSGCEAAFSAGMDLAMIRGGSGQDLHKFLSELYFTMHDLQYRMGKPTIAAMTGPARAAGVTLAVSCDILIATDQGDMSYPEINVGVIPAMHYVHLPKQIGRHKAFELLFGGDTISYVEAAQRGLINKAVPHDQVMVEARKMAANFASKSPVVMKLGRDSFMRANDGDYRRSIENVVETICNIIETDDAQEGLNAFNEKRRPNW
ncbi:MAG: enoyl-CoA hydratase/isomerase family protein [Alphaproteobacteria bacterium]|nr:enoyl-CoA hydratase/isomerase family protein [Alphaproteobacteria bacterium]